MTAQDVAAPQIEPAPEHAHVEGVLAVVAELDPTGLDDQAERVAVGPHRGIVVDVDATGAGNDQGGRARAGDVHGPPGDQAAHYRGARSEDEPRPIGHLQRAVHPRSQVALPVAGSRVPGAAVLVLRDQDGLRRIAGGEGQGGATGLRDVVEVRRAARATARLAVAVQIGEDGCLEGRAAIGRASRMRDHRAVEAAGAGIIVEYGEEGAVQAHLVPHHLTRLGDARAGSVQQAASAMHACQRTVDADAAAGRRHEQVLHLRDPESEDNIVRQVVIDG
jgi:hypothetical protein